MPKTAAGKKQLNIDVPIAIAAHIKNQPHQGRYIEKLVSEDMEQNKSIEQRLKALEAEVFKYPPIREPMPPLE